jgi:ribonuclease HII
MPPTERAIRGVADSKMLTQLARERLVPVIRARAIACGIGAASVREVERDNIYQATVRAMQRALCRLRVSPDMVLVDGRRLPTLGWEHEGIIDGDAKCYSIACASIVAKVTRDRLMRSLANRYPGYGWEHNVGYATAEHREAIGRLGATRHHRVTFL